MLAKIENADGKILIDNEVIAKIVGNTAAECYGIVGMAARNIKDGIARLLKKESMNKGVRIEISNNNSIKIDLYIIVEYGTNIIAICETLISNVKFQVEDYTGVNVEEVNVFVEGIRV